MNGKWNIGSYHGFFSGYFFGLLSKRNDGNKNTNERKAEVQKYIHDIKSKIFELNLKDFKI